MPPTDSETGMNAAMQLANLQTTELDGGNNTKKLKPGNPIE